MERGIGFPSHLVAGTACDRVSENDSLGLRRGEALALKVEDVDLADRWLHVRRNLVRLKLPGEKEGRWIEKTLKTGRSKRDLKLPQVAADALLRQLTRRDAEKTTAGPKWRGSQYLFCTPLGEPIHATIINAALNEACKRAEVRRVRVHDLRYSCGSFLTANGVRTPVIMDILGHTEFAPVKRYVHTSPEVQEAALDKVSAMLEAAKEGATVTPAPSRVAVTVAVN